MLGTLLPLSLVAILAVPAGAAAARILLFHKQNGFVHASTPFAAAALEERLESVGYVVDPTVDSLAFTPANLSRYAAVVFLNTNYRKGPVLGPDEEAAFEAYIHGGGGFAGIHSAIPLDGGWEESVWPWYARLFGARFAGHDPNRTADFVVVDEDHPSTASLPDRFPLVDEWYAVQSAPQPPIRVLAEVEEVVPGDPDPRRRPVSWCQAFEGGRSWVTLAGHDESAFRDPRFLDHLEGGVAWAAGSEAGAAQPAGPIRGGAGGRWRLRMDAGDLRTPRPVVTDGIDLRSLAGRLLDLPVGGVSR